MTIDDRVQRLERDVQSLRARMAAVDARPDPPTVAPTTTTTTRMQPVSRARRGAMAEDEEHRLACQTATSTAAAARLQAYGLGVEEEASQTEDNDRTLSAAAEAAASAGTEGTGSSESSDLLSDAHVKQFVDSLIADPQFNLRLVPDSLERYVYNAIFRGILAMVNKSNIQIIGHQLQLVPVPMPVSATTTGPLSDEAKQQQPHHVQLIVDRDAPGSPVAPAVAQVVPAVAPVAQVTAATSSVASAPSSLHSLESIIGTVPY